jgi:MFS family permease
LDTNYRFLFSIGIGFGLIYLPAIVSVGVYFESKRSFAIGIAVCGSGLGTLAFPAIMPYVINYPSWLDYDGALLLEASFIFICVIFGILMVIFHLRKHFYEFQFFFSRFHCHKNLVK